MGNNPSRTAASNEHARVLREKLRAFVTESEKIKGRVYDEAANEARWNRRLVMSEDNRVIEVGLDGTITDFMRGWTSQAPVASRRMKRCTQ